MEPMHERATGDGLAPGEHRETSAVYLVVHGH